MSNNQTAPYKIGDRVLITTNVNGVTMRKAIITDYDPNHRGYRLKNTINGKSILNGALFAYNELELNPSATKTASKDTNIPLPKDVTLNTILGQEAAKRQIKVGIKQNLAVLLVGDTGTGKTTIIKDLADKANQPYIRFNLTGETTVEEFVGKYTLENGRTIWNDGILLSAMKSGAWLIVDEINVALPEILFVLHSLLDDERAVLVANHDGEVIKPHENFRFFATMNPVDEYAGTKDLNKAFKSRFGMIINLNYPSPKIESVILQTKGGLEQDIADKLVDIAVEVRKLKTAGELFYTLSTRDLLQCANLVKPLSLAQAIKLTIINKANGDGQAIADVVKRVDSSYTELEAIAGTTNLEALEIKLQEYKSKLAEFNSEHQLLDVRLKHLNALEAEQSKKLADKEADLKAVLKKELIAELMGSN